MYVLLCVCLYACVMKLLSCRLTSVTTLRADVLKFYVFMFQYVSFFIVQLDVLYRHVYIYTFVIILCYYRNLQQGVTSMYVALVLISFTTRNLCVHMHMYICVILGCSYFVVCLTTCLTMTVCSGNMLCMRFLGHLTTETFLRPLLLKW